MKTLSIGIVGNLPKPFGGVATTCFHLANQLTNNGHNVYFYDRFPHPQKNLPPNLSEYLPSRKHNYTFAFSSLLFIILKIQNAQLRNFVFILLREIKSLKIRPFTKTTISIFLQAIDIIQYFHGKDINVFHGHHAGLESFAALMVARYYLKCPFVVTVYASEFTMKTLRRWLPIAKYVCNEADIVICISNYTKEQMLQAGAKPKSVSVIPLGVDREHFRNPDQTARDSIMKKFSLQDDCPLILYTGWLIERKGPQILVEALNFIRDLRWQAIIVGPNHGLKDSLINKLSSSRLYSRVSVSEEIDYSSLLALYSMADIFIFPTLSKDEGFGLVGLEAMAHSLPVIASNTGAIPEIVREGQTGFLFEPGNAQELAAKITLLLEHEELRISMGKAARKWAENFDWERTAKRVETQYMNSFNNYD